ncbi:YjbH domain-containing protein [Gammaproteobacteria bacterium]|nr:YjbH domain-containing protein [Gammaproteobacteria bacterium]
MIKYFNLRHCCLFIGIAIPTFGLSEPTDYIYPFSSPSYSNYGTIGLIQNPTARLKEEGTLAFSWSHNEPYLRGSIIAYPFSWMEASYQYTDINNYLYSPSSAFSGSQSLKDKSFDAKFRVLKETNSLPQVAIGMRDLGGTGIFSAEYIVANKFITQNLDFSFGLGWGVMNRSAIENPLIAISDRFRERQLDVGRGGKVSINQFFSGDAGLFLGFEYFIPKLKGLRLKAELDSTQWGKEGRIPVRSYSKVNLGVVYPYSDDLQFKLSYVRGKQLNFGFSYSLSLGDMNPRKMKKKPRPSIDNSSIVKNITAKSDDNLYKATLLYMRRAGFNLQKANLDGADYDVVFADSQYRSPTMAAGRLIGLLDQIAPDQVTNFKVSAVNGGLGLYSASIDRESFARYKKLDSAAAASQSLKREGYNADQSEYEYQPTAKYPAIFTAISPDLQSQIGGPDGFYFGDFKLTLTAELLLNRNFSISSQLSQGIVNNLDKLKLPSDSIIPHVRTDIVDYMKESRDLSIKRLQFNYFKQIAEPLFIKFSGGILESMFNGIGFEMLYKRYDKNYGIGIEAWQVYQREYKQLFGIRDYKTVTGHLTYYYHEPTSNILFKIRGGKYLAKDSGVTFDFSRIFRSNLRIGAFFSLTDISEAEFGEGSFDKGFYFHVPVDLFSPRHFKRSFSWGLRPLTRDGAQAVIHSSPLWSVTDHSSEHVFNRRISDFYD